MRRKHAAPVGTATRKVRALPVAGLILIVAISACAGPVGHGPDVDPSASNQSTASPLSSASPAPTLSPTPSPATTAAGFALCAGEATTVKRAALNCLATPPAVQPAHPVSLVFHFDPKLSKYSATRFRETAEWALPYYYGFFTKLKQPGTIHIVVSLTPRWCGEEVAPFVYGTHSISELPDTYLCAQGGGGANGGHAYTLPNTSFIVVRPSEGEVKDFMTGTGAAKETFYYSVMASEIGHASRGLLMESINPDTGELGTQPYWPIWAAYTSNELVRYLSDLRDGVSIKVAREERVWVMCRHRASWSADYGDERLIGEPAGSSGIYGCPTADPADDSPNQYSMAFMAAEYLVAKHGFLWLTERFMAAPVETRRGPGLRDLDAAARSLGYDSWREIEEDLNANLRAVFGEYGASLP